MMIEVENTGRVGVKSYQLEIPEPVNPPSPFTVRRYATGFEDIESPLAIYIYFTKSGWDTWEHLYVGDIEHPNHDFFSLDFPPTLYREDMAMYSYLFEYFNSVADKIREAEKKGMAWL